LDHLPAVQGETFSKKNQLPGQFPHFATGFRFSSENQSAIFFLSDRDFDLQIGLRPETVFGIAITDLNVKPDPVFSYENRSPIFFYRIAILKTAIAITIKNKSGKTGNCFSFDPVFLVNIDQRFLFCARQNSLLLQTSVGRIGAYPHPVPAVSQTTTCPVFRLRNFVIYDLIRSRR
jgi:hypothetical protein